MDLLEINDDNVRVLLSKFGKKIDKNGFIVTADTNEKVHCRYTGNPLKVNNLGGILPGSEIFIEDSDAAYAAYIAEQLTNDEC